MTPETMPEGFPIERATDWIGRWKEAHGGFFCHDQGEGVCLVQLATMAEKGEQSIAAYALQQELLSDPELKSAVTTLVADAWAKKRGELLAASQLATMEPAGHA